MVAGKDLFKRANSILQRHELALIASEYLGDLEGLGHETLQGPGISMQNNGQMRGRIPGSFGHAQQSAYPPRIIHPYPG